jgi:formate dehydrogenase iron-sulfur subunit
VVFGLPPDPVVTTRYLPEMWRNVAIAASALTAAVVAAFARRRR